MFIKTASQRGKHLSNNSDEKIFFLKGKVLVLSRKAGKSPIAKAIRFFNKIESENKKLADILPGRAN
jgi:hypothetical protein